MRLKSGRLNAKKITWSSIFRVRFQESCYVVKQHVVSLPLTKSPSFRKNNLSHSTSSILNQITAQGYNIHPASYG